MQTNHKGVIIFLSLLIIVGFVVPALAGRETYNDDTPSVYWENWEDDYDATEEDVDGTYRCRFTFVFIGIRRDGHHYHLNIDYDGVVPGLHWEAESLEKRIDIGCRVLQPIIVLLYYGVILIFNSSTNSLYLLRTVTSVTPAAEAMSRCVTRLSVTIEAI